MAHASPFSPWQLKDDPVHYPLLRKLLQKIVGENVTLINPAYETALELGRMLEDHGILNPEEPEEDAPTPYRFFVSDDAKRFSEFAGSILPIDVHRARLVPIEEY